MEYIEPENFYFFDLLHFSGNQTENWDMVFR